MNDGARVLQQVFEAIGCERMRDLPMVNPVLEVATVGFENGACLGILITPWCMNLVLLPNGEEESRAWDALRPGSKQRHGFPSGVYEFVVADEPGVGRFQSCSLFSPMFEFADQATALATARAALAAIMNEAFVDQEGPGQPLGNDAEAPGLAERARSPMSRRDLLRGQIGG